MGAGAFLIVFLSLIKLPRNFGVEHDLLPFKLFPSVNSVPLGWY